jgi:exosome complex component RRP42
MSSEDIVWQVKRDSIRDMIASGKRPDGRAFDEFRKIELIEGYVEKAEGSCFVKLGDTEVLVGVKMAVGTPYPDSPDKGVIVTNAELVPIADPEFYSGPPNENTIELARVVDRGIRESKSIDLEKLCITPGEFVWTALMDIHVLDNFGNLVDAATMGLVKALWNSTIPKFEDEKVNREEKGTEKLPVTDKPVSCTFVKIGNGVVLDPTLDEEKSMDAKMTLTTTENGHLCAAQKSGNGSFTKEELDKMFGIATERGKEIRSLF